MYKHIVVQEQLIRITSSIENPRLPDDLFGGPAHIYVCDGGRYAILIRKYSLLTDKLYGGHLKPVNQGLE